MQKRTLGTTGLSVSPLAFGGNVFGWTVDEPTGFRILDSFVGAGFNFIDTADVYSNWAPGNTGGESESMIGRWMKARRNRERVVIATKVGSAMSEEKKGLSAPYILRAVEDSLRRLQTDYIDLYQSHVDDYDTPQGETQSAYAKLVVDGKVRAIGASNFTAVRLASALAASRERNWPAYGCLQPRYNLYDRADFESNLAPLCVRENIGVIPYPALASGFLTGKYRSEADLSKSPRGARIKDRLNERGFRIIAALDRVADTHRATPAQVALAWLMSRPAVTAPIVSATSLEQLDEVVKSAHLVLDADSMAILDHAGA